jgi:uncharacterized coiled-coil DUF342 family protein
MTWTDAILPLVLAVIAATPGILALLKGRSKDKADAASTITGAARQLLEEYRAKIDEIESTVAEQETQIRCQQLELNEQLTRIKKLEHERGEIMKGVASLCTQIRNLGHEPVWEPKREQ